MPSQANIDGDAQGDDCDGDDDNDGLADASDSCAKVAGNATGCPPVGGALSLKYSAKKKRFKGAVDSSAAACELGRPVTIFRKKKGDDLRVTGAMTDATGKYKVSKRAKDGKYYAVVDQILVMGSADCAAAKSAKVTVG